MTEHEEELDPTESLELDFNKILLGETSTKKKSKSKDKSKKRDDSDGKSSGKSSSASQKAGSGLPLSLQTATSDDLQSFEHKLQSHKSQLPQARGYKVTERYKAGEIINHAQFGTGFVITETGINKIEVLFKVGRKLLIMGQQSQSDKPVTKSNKQESKPKANP